MKQFFKKNFSEQTWKSADSFEKISAQTDGETGTDSAVQFHQRKGFSAARPMRRMMQKCFCLALCFILTGAAAFSSDGIFAEAATADYIKVGLSYGQSSSTSAQLTSDSGFAVATAGNNAIVSSGTVWRTQQSITLTLSGDSVQVKAADGTLLSTLKGDGTECITGGSYASTGDDTIRFKGKSYRGGIIPYINSSGQLNIINYLSIDDYVRGVVHSEIGQSSHIEAIKAQAVAIRSFAVIKKGTHNSQGFDMCATTHCQVYSGADSEYPSTNQAVDETKGELVYYEGKPVAAYYFANSGGHTENSEDTWSAALGYLRGKADEYSPEYTWTVRLTRADLNKAFNAKGLGNIESITIDSVNESGYVAAITVKGSRDSITYKKESIRSALGTSLKSRNFTFTAEGAGISSGENPSGGTEAGGTVKNTYYGRSSMGTGALNSTVTVLSADGVATRNLNGMTAMGANGLKTVMQTTVPGTSPSDGDGTPTGSVTTVTFSSDSDVLIINGKGYGHGVGMSQQGAQQMGKKGFTYKQILQYYYTGIEVK